MKFTRSLRQVILLFVISCLLSVAIPPGVAQVNPPPGVQLVRQARSLYQEERFSEAIPLLQQAAAAFEANGENLARATALSNLAATYGQLALWEEAEKAVNSSLSAVRTQAKTPEQQRILAETLNIQGQLQLERGQSQEAIDKFYLSAKILEQIESQNPIFSSSN